MVLESNPNRPNHGLNFKWGHHPLSISSELWLSVICLVSQDPTVQIVFYQTVQIVASTWAMLMLCERWRSARTCDPQSREDLHVPSATAKRKLNLFTLLSLGWQMTSPRKPSYIYERSFLDSIPSFWLNQRSIPLVKYNTRHKIKRYFIATLSLSLPRNCYL